MHNHEKAHRFAALHVKGDPLRLCNAWDAGSAKAIAEAGAAAIATSSWAVAAAHGYADGECMPMEQHVQIVGRIAASVDLPVSVDFEGGYSEDDAVLAANVGQLLQHGIIGINFEDRIVGGSGLHAPARQAARIAAIRAEASRRGVDLFINARTDLFFQPGADHAATLPLALERAHAYAAAGASGLFVPGLQDETLIATLCEASPLPVNVMVMGDTPLDTFARLGVSRISLGPKPWLVAMKALSDAARLAIQGGASHR